VRLAGSDESVRIAVSDTGDGIRADFLPYVFDRFRQADSSASRAYGGLGLGLAIVRHLVELHGGTVRAESPGEGRGAALTVNIPIGVSRAAAPDSDEVRADDRDAAPTHTAPVDGLRVLVVEDDADTREALAIVLRQQNAQVIAVTSAVEAMEAMDRSPPDVLVCDIGLPGEDGYALIRRVRARDPERGGRTPAVALTAFAQAEDRRRALQAGFQVHVSKPLDPADLTEVVAMLARRSHETATMHGARSAH
jgi:CheY-like chemotaxis protein